MFSPSRKARGPTVQSPRDLLDTQIINLRTKSDTLNSDLLEVKFTSFFFPLQTLYYIGVVGNCCVPTVPFFCLQWWFSQSLNHLLGSCTALTLFLCIAAIDDCRFSCCVLSFCSFLDLFNLFTLFFFFLSFSSFFPPVLFCFIFINTS